MISSLFLRSLPAFAFVGAVTSVVAGDSQSYQLDTEYSGATFFEGFDFFTDPDPTAGFVTYNDATSALDKDLISVDNSGTAYINVDSTNAIDPLGAGRDSVRITTKKQFTHGLIISDITNMPGGVCGTWPAHWSFGPDWPTSGEIDIIEGVNSQSKNLMSLHVSGECSIAGDFESGDLQESICDQANGSGSGCGVLDSTTVSYGKDFNSNNGGVFATLWTSDFIRIWFFPSGTIPSDITDGTPDPSTWGEPASNFQGSCEIDDHFKDHNIIFDTTFCGQWGGAVWSSDPVCGSLAPTCNEFVAENPSAFSDMYWAIKSVKVYQLQDTPVTPPVSPTSTEPPSTSTEPPSTTSDLSIGTTEAATPTPTSAPYIKPTVELYTFFSCYTESAADALGIRTLSAKVTAYDTMTLETCAADCEGFKYFGTEYGRECYCGDDFTATAVPAAIGDCSMLCAGDGTEFCGGPNRVSVYELSADIEISPSSELPTSTSTMEYSTSTSSEISSTTDLPDSSSSTDLPATSTSDITSTTDFQDTSSTIDLATSSSSDITSATDLPASSTTLDSDSSTAVVETSTSSDFAASSTITSDSSAIETSAPTTSTGLWRNATSTLYQNSTTLQSTTTSGAIFIEYPPTTASVEIGSSTSAPSASSEVGLPSTTPTSSPNPENIGSFEYLGCYQSADSFSGFTLIDSTSDNTPEICVSKCSASAYAGIFGADCYCSETFLGASQKSEGSCDVPCPGNPDETCGGIIPVARRALDSGILLTIYTCPENVPSQGSSGSGVTSSATTGTSSSITTSSNSVSSLSTTSTSTLTSSSPSSGSVPSTTLGSSTAPLTASSSVSTIISTTIYTVTSCASTVTDCPAIIGKVTTEIVSLYTTICPITHLPTPTPTSSPSAQPTTYFSTSTVYSTKVYTVTSCAPTITDCPARIGKVTTEIISLYTTVCPITAHPTSTHTTPSLTSVIPKYSVLGFGKGGVATAPIKSTIIAEIPTAIVVTIPNISTTDNARVATSVAQEPMKTSLVTVVPVATPVYIPSYPAGNSTTIRPTVTAAPTPIFNGLTGAGDKVKMRWTMGVGLLMVAGVMILL